MEEAVGERIFTVVGNATHLSFDEIGDHVTYHHERDFIQPAQIVLEQIGGGITGEDVFHLVPTGTIDSSQFEERK